MQIKFKDIDDLINSDFVKHYEEDEIRSVRDKIIKDTGREPIYKLFKKKDSNEIRVYGYDNTCWKYVLLYVVKK